MYDHGATEHNQKATSLKAARHSRESSERYAARRAAAEKAGEERSRTALYNEKRVQNAGITRHATAEAAEAHHRKLIDAIDVEKSALLHEFNVIHLTGCDDATCPIAASPNLQTPCPCKKGVSTHFIRLAVVGADRIPFCLLEYDHDIPSAKTFDRSR
jgi:hypothetical protein